MWPFLSNLIGLFQLRVKFYAGILFIGSGPGLWQTSARKIYAAELTFQTTRLFPFLFFFFSLTSRISHLTLFSFSKIAFLNLPPKVDSNFRIFFNPFLGQHQHQHQAAAKNVIHINTRNSLEKNLLSVKNKWRKKRKKGEAVFWAFQQLRWCDEKWPKNKRTEWYRYRNTLVLHHRLQEYFYSLSLFRCLCLHLPWFEHFRSSLEHSLFSSRARWNKPFCVCDLSLSYSGYIRGKFWASLYTLHWITVYFCLQP